LSHECVIYFGDELGPPPPLIGRPFIHGVYDCYSLIRDFYRTNAYSAISDYHGVSSILLPEQPRDFGWWDSRNGDGTVTVPKTLYTDNFKAAGFRQITLEEMRPGDVFLAQVMAPVTNHGGVYLGRGEIIHHLRGRLSKTDVAGRWLNYVTHCLRYEGAAALEESPDE
jgi:cell wall-associated NlpC family hydrolase